MPKTVNHDEYRKELLEKCFFIFSQKGYSKVTLREIATEIGVSTGTIYHYFPAKQNILKQMFIYIMETNVEAYSEKMKNADTLKSRLEYFAEFLIEFEKYYKHVLLLAIDLFRVEEIDDSEKILTTFSKYYTETISKTLKIPTQYARSLFIYIIGLVFHSLVTPNHIVFADQVEILRDTLKTIMKEIKETKETPDQAVFDKLLEGKLTSY
jgi:AcrR family transcriptional regulator